MRDGRILDSGTPAELIDRHARRSTVRFSLPEAGASLLEQLRRTEGVQAVELTGTRVTLAGDRRMIAYVGAALVSWGPVPPDLSVHVPDLEDALLRLLEEVRQVVGMLHAHAEPGTAPLPGVDGLPALVERFRSTGADVTLIVEGDVAGCPRRPGWRSTASCRRP
jgi:hypothetical protein